MGQFGKFVSANPLEKKKLEKFLFFFTGNVSEKSDVFFFKLII